MFDFTATTNNARFVLSSTYAITCVIIQLFHNQNHNMIELIKLIVAIGIISALLHWFGAPEIIVRILCIIAGIVFVVWVLGILGLGSIFIGVHY